MNDKRAGRTAGFTLIEVLLAVFIMTIIMVTIFGSFQLLFSNSEAVEEHLRIYAMAQGCFYRMTADLTAIQITPDSMYQSPEKTDTPDPYRLVCEEMDTDVEGGRYKLRFASGAHLPLSGGLPEGIGEITYYVDRMDGVNVLRRSDCQILEASPELPRNDPILCRDVKSLRFLFYDEDGEEHETWDSDADETGYATPAAIRLILEMESGGTVHPFETMVALPVRRLKKENTL
ncbi:MAG: type II secretion system protein GspJ [Thermodesulfobacteriota bacterium]